MPSTRSVAALSWAVISAQLAMRASVPSRLTTIGPRASSASGWPLTCSLLPLLSLSVLLVVVVVESTSGPGSAGRDRGCCCCWLSCCGGGDGIAPSSTVELGLAGGAGQLVALLVLVMGWVWALAAGAAPPSSSDSEAAGIAAAGTAAVPAEAGGAGDVGEVLPGTGDVLGAGAGLAAPPAVLAGLLILGMGSCECERARGGPASDGTGRAGEGLPGLLLWRSRAAAAAAAAAGIRIGMPMGMLVLPTLMGTRIIGLTRSRLWTRGAACNLLETTADAALIRWRFEVWMSLSLRGDGVMGDGMMR